MTERVFAAESNLAATYLMVGLHAEGARRIDGDGFVGCLSSIDHPVANFAIVREVNPWSVRELGRISEMMPNFHIYGLSVADPDTRLEVLTRNGFDLRYGLDMMERSPLEAVPPAHSQLRLVEAVEGPARADAGRFMADQFFPNQAPRFRSDFAFACSSSPVRLYSALLGETRVGACMGHRDRTTWGLYNVCVDAKWRHRGFGRELVRLATETLGEPGEPIVLQCEPALSGWYQSLGFQSISGVQVFSRRRLADTIM